MTGETRPRSRAARRLPAATLGAGASAGAAAVPGASPASAAPTVRKRRPTATPAVQPRRAQPPSALTLRPPLPRLGQYKQYAPAAQATPGTRTQQAFISLIAPGAVAAEQRWGVPAAVTIAQAIEESSWGNSQLAADYHNLFGIKGSGPAGSIGLPTSEFYGGQWVTIDAQFRVYHNVAESIADHAELLATSGYYQRAMADRAIPDAFAHDLTGVYATDPDYGANLIAIMRLYNLYRFDGPTSAAPTPPASPAASPAITRSQPAVTQPAVAQPPATHPAAVHPSAGSTTADGHSATGRPGHRAGDQRAGDQRAGDRGAGDHSRARVACHRADQRPCQRRGRVSGGAPARRADTGRGRADRGLGRLVSAGIANSGSANSASPAHRRGLGPERGCHPRARRSRRGQLPAAALRRRPPPPGTSPSSPPR